MTLKLLNTLIMWLKGCLHPWKCEMDCNPGLQICNFWRISIARDSTGEGNGNHFSVLAWKIPWTEEPDGLLPMRLHRVGHNWSDLAAAAAKIAQAARDQILGPRARKGKQSHCKRVQSLWQREDGRWQVTWRRPAAADRLHLHTNYLLFACAFSALS